MTYRQTPLAGWYWGYGDPCSFQIGRQAVIDLDAADITGVSTPPPADTEMLSNIPPEPPSPTISVSETETAAVKQPGVADDPQDNDRGDLLSVAPSDAPLSPEQATLAVKQLRGAHAETT